MLAIAKELNLLRKKDYLLNKKIKVSEKTLNERMDNIMTEVNRISKELKDLRDGR
jgi:hypothetical protein